MEKSETIKELATAMAKFQASVPKIDLDREVEVQTKTGGKYKFRYATFANIIDKIKKPLSEHGLSYAQLVNENGSVTTILMHESGEWISSTLLITGEKTPQGIGSTITYTKRYALSSILGVCADDDDDANIGQGNSFNFNGNEKSKTTKSSKKPENSPSASNGKRVVPVDDLLKDDFLQSLHDVELKKKQKDSTATAFKILESNYILTLDEIKRVCNALGEFEKRTNQVTETWTLSQQ